MKDKIRKAAEEYVKNLENCPLFDELPDLITDFAIKQCQNAYDLGVLDGMKKGLDLVKLKTKK